MISLRSHSADWQSALRKEKFKGKDPVLIEKVIKALSLLEHLKLEGLQFVFKGGTSLLLVIPEPRRFSIDIDLVLEAKPNDLTEVFDRVVRRGVFTAWE